MTKKILIAASAFAAMCLSFAAFCVLIDKAIDNAFNGLSLTEETRARNIEAKQSK